MKRFVWMFIALLAVCTTAMAQRKCKACNGTGTIVKSVSVSRYGLSNDYKLKCPTCGKVYLNSSGHTHIQCRHCGGTGYVDDYSSSSGSYGSASDRLNEIAIANPQAYNVAMTLKYGLPMSNEEYAEIAELDNYNASQYMKWRDVLNQYVVTVNKSMRMGWLFGNLEGVDSTKRRTDEQLSQLSSTFQVTDRLAQIANGLLERYQNAYVNYRAQEEVKANANRMQERLFQYQLNSLW